MPNNRFNRARQVDVNMLQRLPVAMRPGEMLQMDSDRGMEQGQAVACCLPSGCDRYLTDPILMDDPGEAVKVLCNNEQCRESGWMHVDCFRSWEQHILAYLRSCGRARNWSEKQRLQNLWSKKGYDLAYRVCDCRCQRGHLRKDLDYQLMAMSSLKSELDRRNKKSKARARLLPHANKMQPQSYVLPINNNNNRPQLRIRTSSFSSTGSSPPSSAGTPPLTPGSTSSTGTVKRNSFDFFEDEQQAAAGNIFQRRINYSAFKSLPVHQQNPYHIRMEDDGPYGNDEIRIFVLSNLSKARITNVNCVACKQDLVIYDRYPLIDGTFFLSPQKYNTDFQVNYNGHRQYLNAICMNCAEDNCISCRACHRPWNGSALIVGTMYSYDIFASSPCCSWRVSCKQCRRPMLDATNGIQFYSEYSRPFECPHCRCREYHFIKPLEDSFLVVPRQKFSSIWNCA